MPEETSAEKTKGREEQAHTWSRGAVTQCNWLHREVHGRTGEMENSHFRKNPMRIAQKRKMAATEVLVSENESKHTVALPLMASSH